MRRQLLVLLLAILALSCSSSGGPVAPDAAEPPSQEIELSGTAQSMQPGRVLWGLYEWVIDLQNETFEVVPLRDALMHINVVRDMNAYPPRVGFDGFTVDKSKGTIGLDVYLYHPYPHRPNLAGFDVHGIMIGPGSVSGFDDPTLVVAGLDDPHILNPDGWSRWWNPVEFRIDNDLFSYTDGRKGIPHSVGDYNATLNAYKTFSDDLGNVEYIGEMNLPDRLIFTTDAVHSRHYDVWFPVENDKFVLRYNYAIDASWEPIPGYQPGDPVDAPSDWEATANQAEPFWALVETKQNSLYYENSSVQGGNAVLEVKVFDWQGYLTDGDVAFEIQTVKFECPGVYDGVEWGIMTDPGAGSMAYATYEITLDGSKLTTNEPGIMLLTVVSAIGDYQPAQTGYSGSAPLSYYRFIELPAISPQAPPNEPPVAAAEVDETERFVGEPFTFDATSSDDPDGEIVLYEWDFDGDGVYGDSYDSGTDEMPVIAYDTPGVRNVGLRVQDDDEAYDELDEPIVITVNEPPNVPPVAVADTGQLSAYVGEVVLFDGSDSYDTDGFIVSWEWDFDFDGVYGDSYHGGTDEAPEYIFDAPGLFSIDLKVTDDDGATDTLNEPISIIIDQLPNVPPVAVASVLNETIFDIDPVEFSAEGSYDPDGTINEWLWDFNLSGSYGDPYDFGVPEHPFRVFSVGAHVVDLKVVDDRGGEDTLDEPLEFYVRPSVSITLPEDQWFKYQGGWTYAALNALTPFDLPIGYGSPSGPWDFTTVAYPDEPDTFDVLPPDHPEVAPYVPVYFPASTAYFVRRGLVGSEFLGTIWNAEEPDYYYNLLWLYGFFGENEITGAMDFYLYNETTGGACPIHFPLDLSMDESWVNYFPSVENGFQVIRYHEWALGQGLIHVPYSGYLNGAALMTRTIWELEVFGQPALQVMIYRWLDDSGVEVARLYTSNDTETENFDPETYAIFGSSRLLVLVDE